MMKQFIFTFLALFLLTGGTAFGESAKDIPLPAAIALNKSEEFARAGKYEKAIKVLKDFKAKKSGVDKATAIKKGYSNYFVDFVLANYLLMQSRVKEASFYYRESLKGKPDLSAAWLNLAKCYHDMDKMDEAGDAFVRGYETGSPKKAESLYFGAVCFLGGEKYEKARKTFLRLFKAHPERSELKWKEAMVQTLFALKRPAEAIPYMEELAGKSRGKKQEEWWEMLLSQYMSLNMEKKAFALARDLTRRYPTRGRWWKALAHLHLQKNRYEDGLVALTIYGFLSPLTYEERTLMGDISLSLNIPSRAILHYEALLKERQDPAILKKIVRAYMGLHDREKALEWAEKGLVGGGNQSLLSMKGDILYEMDRFEEAAKVYERLGRVGKNSGRAFLMLGYARWGGGDTVGAREAFGKASRHSKEKKAALKALKQLKVK